MDTITHALLGAVTAQLGFRQRIGRDATWVAVAAAMSPDLDIFAGPLLAAAGFDVAHLGHMAAHRGLSHSLLASPVIAAPIAAAWWWLRRRRERGRTAAATAGAPAARAVPFWLLYLCVFLAEVAHPLIDWCTAYGTELLAPLSDARYALNVVPIVDIFYTPLLVLTLLACFVVRKVGRGPMIKATLAIGWTGFCLSLGYLCAGEVLRERTISDASRLAALFEPEPQSRRPAAVVRAEAYPALGSILLWRAVVETDGGWVAVGIRPIGGAVTGVETARKQDSPWVERALDLPAVRKYGWFAMGWVRAAESRQDGRHVVELHDMRYSLRPDGLESLWPLQVTFGEAGEVVSVRSLSTYPGEDRWQFIRRTWRDIWGE